MCILREYLDLFRCLIWYLFPRIKILGSQSLSVSTHSQISLGNGDWMTVGNNQPLDIALLEFRCQLSSGAFRGMSGGSKHLPAN